jgi:hypothetical protein
MNSRALIKYKGFWDVPRIFLTHHQGRTFLFNCAFDEALDDYPDSYKVYLLPDIPDDMLPKDWTTLPTQATQYLGEVPVAHVQFDTSKRQSIDTTVLEQLIARQPLPS